MHYLPAPFKQVDNYEEVDYIYLVSNSSLSGQQTISFDDKDSKQKQLYAGMFYNHPIGGKNRLGIDLATYFAIKQKHNVSHSRHFFKRSLMVAFSVKQLLNELSKPGMYRDFAGMEKDMENYYSSRIVRRYFVSIRYRFRQGARNTRRLGR